jgi:multicomponent Na+:H+ antiporter subunit D
MKIWVGVFWAPATEGDGIPPSRDKWSAGPALMVVPTTLLVTATVMVGVFAGPISGLAERAAADLLDTDSYVNAVNHAEGVR